MFIKTVSLSRVYRKGSHSVSALQDVSMEMKQGEMLAIVGRSGSGKSTLLNLLGALDRASSGRIFFNGRDLAAFSRTDMANHRRSSVGMIFQSFNLIPSRTARENVELALAFGGVSGRKKKERASALLRMVGLSDRLTHLPSELSGGECQRVAIARALANNPMLLLADEPTGNLDSETSAGIMELLVELNKNNGLSVILVTHDQEIAEAVSDRIIRLKDGRIEEIIDKRGSHECI